MDRKETFKDSANATAQVPRKEGNRRAGNFATWNKNERRRYRMEAIVPTSLTEESVRVKSNLSIQESVKISLYRLLAVLAPAGFPRDKHQILSQP